jgi:hypothetical protein
MRAAPSTCWAQSGSVALDAKSKRTTRERMLILGRILVIQRVLPGESVTAALGEERNACFGD